MDYYMWILPLLVVGFVLPQTEGALPYAANISSINVTHHQAILRWEPPINLTTVSSYTIFIYTGNSTVTEITVNDPSTSSYELSNLDIWSIYTAQLTTYDISGSIIGTDSHSFSTRFYFGTAETVSAIAAAFFIGACYIAALAIKFSCNLETDEGALRKIILDEHEKRRRQKREKRARLRGGGYMRSLSRQFSSLLSWGRHDSTDDSTVGEDDDSERSYQSSGITSYEHDKHLHTVSSWQRGTHMSEIDTPEIDMHLRENDTPLGEHDTPGSTSDIQIRDSQSSPSMSGILSTVEETTSVGTCDTPDIDANDIVGATPSNNNDTCLDEGDTSRSTGDTHMGDTGTTSAILPTGEKNTSVDICDRLGLPDIYANHIVEGTSINEIDTPLGKRDTPGSMPIGWDGTPVYPIGDHTRAGKIETNERGHDEDEVSPEANEAVIDMSDTAGVVCSTPISECVTPVSTGDALKMGKNLTASEQCTTPQFRLGTPV